MLLVLQWEGLFGPPVHATRAMAASDLIAAGFNMATKFELQPTAKKFALA